jgi:3-oxoacyl-[acyl-carrier-protein] synthase-3
MYILGVGHFHPETVLDNFFLESLDIGTTNEWILDRVGIATRRTVLPLDYIRSTRNKDPRAAKESAKYTAAQLGVRAAQMAIERAGIKPDDIALCVAAASVPEMCIPAHACLIANGLGIEAPAFDLNAACSSLMAQIHFLKNVDVSGPILLVQTETYTMATDYNDRQTAVLWGDGAAAMILSKEGKARIVETTFGSNPSEADKVFIPYAAHFSQQGNRVQRFAILQTEATFNALKKKSDSPIFVGHQANLSMLNTASKRMKIEDHKHYYNVDRYGNCGAAGAPSVLSERWDFFRSGEQLVIVTVGSGLSWGGTVVEFI